MAFDKRKREGQQLLLRFPDGSDLRDRLEERAKANSRSLTGEIIQRLESSLHAPQPGLEPGSDLGPVTERQFNRLAERVEWLEGRIKILEKR